MSNPRSDEKGVLLLEAMVALVLLGGFGLGMLSAVRAAVALEDDARQKEAAVLEAERVLVAMTLLSRRDLDLRLGERGVRGTTVMVSRPTRTIYRIAVATGPSEAGVNLVTLVHRP